MQGPKIIVEDVRRPWLRWLIAALVVCILGLLMWGGYGLALSVAGGDWAQMRDRAEALAAERDALSDEMGDVRRENQRLREQLTFLEQSVEIDQMACASVRSSLKSLQADLADVREQVAFYRGIVSPEQGRAGLRVHGVTVQPLEMAGHYTVQVMLVQSVRRERDVSGTAWLVIEGLQDDAATELDWGSVVLSDEDRLGFSFRYFQELASEFALPDNFVPTRVRVLVDPRGPNNLIEQQFAWSEIIRG